MFSIKSLSATWYWILETYQGTMDGFRGNTTLQVTFLPSWLNFQTYTALAGYSFSFKFVGIYISTGDLNSDNYHFLCKNVNDFPFRMALPFRNGREAREDGLLALYGEIEKAAEIYFTLEGSRTITIIIDDVSLMEVAANGLLSNLNHEDIHSSANMLPLILQLEYLADVIIKANALVTGLASYVLGQEADKLQKRLY
ncbi:hypothetical protein RND71_014427 [Anisodus tanguticus]|uniref:Uncharacterized protein n=1 Tax=Anisodus tanguticus TaxID=243964 RepID=A0AAE1VF15_9SOLA|nr:hypothetical protein RND71_014427 [Anisodus tanguticus]